MYTSFAVPHLNKCPETVYRLRDVTYKERMLLRVTHTPHLWIWVQVKGTTWIFRVFWWFLYFGYDGGHGTPYFGKQKLGFQSTTDGRRYFAIIRSNNQTISDFRRDKKKKIVNTVSPTPWKWKTFVRSNPLHSSEGP